MNEILMWIMCIFVIIPTLLVFIVAVLLAYLEGKSGETQKIMDLVRQRELEQEYGEENESNW